MRISDWSSDVCSSDLLTRAYNDNRTLLANNALSAVNDLRGRIEASRNDLYGQNRAAADPSAAASQAAAQVGFLGTPPAFSPLGQLFGNFTNMATTGLAAERAGDRKSTRLNSSH